MPVQTINITVDVPEDQDTAAESSAAGLVDKLTEDVDGLVVLAASYAGRSLLPTPTEALDEALTELQAMVSKTGNARPSQSDLAAAVDRVAKAAAVVERLATAPAAATTEAPAPVDPATAAATAAATVTSLPVEPTPVVEPEPAPEVAPEVTPAPVDDAAPAPAPEVTDTEQSSPAPAES